MHTTVTSISGSDNPDIILIKPSMSEKYDKYLFASLAAKGINKNNCKIIQIDGFSLFPELVISSDYTNIIEEHSRIIEECKPQLIILVGGNISSLFIENFTCISECHGLVYKCKFGLNEYMVMPFYHPAYIFRHGNDIELKKSFINDIQKVLLVCTGEISNVIASSIQDSSPQVHDFEDETHICLTYNEFDKFCKDQIDKFDLIAYDIETNAREKTSKDYKVVGFSLASNSKKGCYVVLSAIDYKMSNNDQKLVEARLRKILLGKRILVYNYMHEELATLNWLKIEMPNVDDLFVMVKLLMGNASEYEGNGGLKIQCEMNLNTTDWSKDLDLYMEFFKSFNKNQESIQNLLNKYYSKDEVIELLPLIEEQVANKDNYVKTSKATIVSYGVVPYKLIGKYGGIDSSILFDLLDFYKNRISELNAELGIDLMIGYNHWMNHHYAGFTLERNGAYFNDEKASAVEKWCNEGMEEALRNMIQSDLSEPYLRNKVYSSFLMYLKESCLEKILGVYAFPKRMYKSSVKILLNNQIYDNPLKDRFKRMSMLPDNKGYYKLELGHIETLAKEFLPKYEEIFDAWYKKYIAEFNAENHPVSEMKSLMNPTATGEPWKKFLTSIFISEDIKYAKFYRIMISVIEDPKFSMDRYYAEDDKKLLKLVIKLKDMDLSDDKKFNIFMKFFNEPRTIKSKYLNRKINEALNYSMESTDDDHILELYDLYVLNGLNIEDKSTWSKNFEFIYNYRRYKKFSKIITTYINGRVGRNSVWYVDKESYSNGDELTPRLFEYYKRDQHDLTNKVPVLQSSFLVDMADTGRWKASMHTIPSADTTKGIFTSRFKGGMIAMPDCSQAEIRVLAAVSQDKNLMEAFQKEGTDIHKYVASLCFCNGDINAVTKTQRKIAKGAVFGILYGESLESFAESFTHGDVDEAQKIFDFFFTAFPRIKDYVEDSHNQFNVTSKVALRMMNRFINLAPIVIENGGDTNKALRQSQNFIIQGQTCDIAGLILYKVCRYIKDNNLKSKPFCFIHDSIEIDLHPDEVFLMLDMLKPLFNDFPMKTFGIPMASDIVFSTNMGAEIDSHILEHDKEYNDVTIKMEGFEDDITEVINTWNEVYDKVECISQENGEEKYVPMAGMFQKKVVISKLMGTYRREISCVYHVIRKEYK